MRDITHEGPKANAFGIQTNHFDLRVRTAKNGYLTLHIGIEAFSLKIQGQD